MALKCTVKISAVNNLSDARYVAGMGVDMMGFQVESHTSNHVTPQQFAAITGWVSGVTLVAELEKLSTGQLDEILQDYAVQAVQVNQPYESDLSQLSLPLIICLKDMEERQVEQVLQDYHAKATHFLLEYSKPLAPEQIHSMLEWAREYPILLSAEFSPDQITTWIDQGLQGIALKGGQELKPGYREFDEMADMLILSEQSTPFYCLNVTL